MADGLPPPKKPDTPFEMPEPTEDVRTRWETDVSDAIDTNALALVHTKGTWWTLAGWCPRCGDYMSNEIETSVVTSEGVLSARKFGTDDLSTFTTEVVCTCKVDPAHLKDVAGCGYGARLLIRLPFP